MEQKLKGNAITRLTELVLKYRWGVLLFSVLLALGIGSGASQLGFDGDYHVFFSESNPELEAFDALQEKYTKDDNVLIVLTPDNGDVFTKDNLMAIEELTAEAWNTPFSSRVDAITNFQHTKAEGDDLYVADLSYETAGKSAEEIAQIRSVALQEPLLLNRLINKEGSVTAINVTVKIPGKDLTEVPQTMAFTREMISNFKEKHPQFAVHLSGMVAMNTAFFEASMNDSATLIPIMFLVVILMVGLLTRSVSATIATLAVIILSIMAAAGAAGLMGIKLTPPSAVFPTIILTLAVADSIHILITIINKMKAGYDKRSAIIESIRLNFMPVLITSLTTIIGFLSMNFGDVPPFWDLGNITSAGMLAAFVFSIFTLPALMAILPLKVKAHKDYQEKKTIYERFGLWVAQRPVLLSLSSISAIAILAVLALNNVFNDEFIKYFDDSIAFRSDTDYISENLTGMYNIEFSVGAGESGGINDPMYLQKLDEFEQWLNEQPEVVHVNTFAEVARRVNKSMHGDDPSHYRVPENREEAAQYLLLYEMSLPFGLDLNNQINVDKSETRVTVTTKNISSADLVTFSNRTSEWLAGNTPEEMHALGSSPTLMFSQLGFRQAESMFNGNIIALLLISLVLIIALRNIKLGLLSIIPNVTPVIVGFGIWALFSGQINTGMIVVFGMTLGIIVDDTVHFLSKYLRGRTEEGLDAIQAVQYAFSNVGKALLTTTLVLMAGFFILGQSSFGMNSNMARISVIILAAALIIDFLLLPALLILIDGRKDRAAAKKLSRVAVPANS
ncbi:MAG: efflux RND transporter permease subunit [Bacteroidota bacterium]